MKNVIVSVDVTASECKRDQTTAPLPSTYLFMDLIFQIPDVKIEKMLRLLQEVERGRSLDEATTTVGREYSVDPEQDLNKLDDATLDKKKKVM